MKKIYRIAIIGYTGRGGYGHELDMAFDGVEDAKVVAVSDPDDLGRQQTLEKTGAMQGYSDYHQMLDAEKPDITVVASREIGDHLDMVLATAEAGSHIYLEKPVAASPFEVERMITACQKKDLLLVVAHPWRGHPPIQKGAIPLIKSGRIGQPRLARIYGMGGHHGGNQLFLDLCPHFFDFLWQLFGPPLWCHSHITQDGRSVTSADLKPGVEGMGLVAGNGIKAYYAFAGGVAAEFESYQGDGHENPYRIDIHGTSGTISLPGPMSNQPDIYYHPLVNPGLFDDNRWEVIEVDPPPSSDKWLQAHHRMASSMISILKGETAEWELVGGHNAKLYLEMAMMAHASHISGSRVQFPLVESHNPFDTWRD